MRLSGKAGRRKQRRWHLLTSLFGVWLNDFEAKERERGRVSSSATRNTYNPHDDDEDDGEARKQLKDTRNSEQGV